MASQQQGSLTPKNMLVIKVCIYIIYAVTYEYIQIPINTHEKKHIHTYAPHTHIKKNKQIDK